MTSHLSIVVDQKTIVLQNIGGRLHPLAPQAPATGKSTPGSGQACFEKAEEAEQYSQEKNHREFYAALNAVYGPRSRSSHPVKCKDGELLTAPDKIKDRWVEPFNDLLNQPTDVDLSTVDDIDQLPVIKSMNHPIEEQELDLALSNTRLRKSPATDGILPEVLVHGEHRFRAFLLVLFNICLTTEIIPAHRTG